MMHPAWWMALGAVILVAVIVWLAYRLMGALDDVDQDPYDDNWDDDAYWANDNPTPLPPDVPVHAGGDKLMGFDPMKAPEKRREWL